MLLVALALAAQQPTVISDYFPGPWIVFFNERGQLPPETAQILAHAREATQILSIPVLRLCPEGAPVSARRERRNVEAVRRELVKSGVPKARIVSRVRCGAPLVVERPTGVRIDVVPPEQG